jgi:hypothetical protein
VTNGEYCSICAKPAAAAWHGASVVAVCGECAIEILPALIADAVEMTRGHEQAKSVVVKIELRFWRAVAMRLFRGTK